MLEPTEWAEAVHRAGGLDGVAVVLTTAGGEVGEWEL